MSEYYAKEYREWKKSMHLRGMSKMRKMKLVVLVPISIVVLSSISGCSNENNKTKKDAIHQGEHISESNHKQSVKEDNSLQSKLNRLLEYNGKECPSLVTHLSIASVSYDIDSSSHTTKINKHTQVYSNGNGSYTTSTYTTGGNTVTKYYGYTLHASIKNNSNKTINAYFEFSAPTQYYSSGFFGLFAGTAAGNGIEESEYVTVPPEGLEFSKYYKLNGWISGTLNTSLSSASTEDDIRYKEAKTIMDYHNYLQKDGCHYHLQEAKRKIKELFAKKIFAEALHIKDHEKRIKALEKYLKVFKDDKRAKKILDRDKRMVELLKKTEKNNVIIWEHGNPLVYSFENALHDKKYTSNLLFFVDDYLKAAEEVYYKKIAYKKQALPNKPKLEDFAQQPIEKEYPAKPSPSKGEFEKQKDFEVRKKKLLAEWQQKVNVVDTQYIQAVNKYKIKQKELYDQVYNKWLDEKKNIEKTNTRLKQEYSKNISAINSLKNYWIWQAAVVSIGLEDFTFKKLQYNSEKEVFEYIVEGGVLNFRFEGTIAIPIAQAKEFKEYVKNNLSIVFQIQDNKLYIKDFIYKDKPSGYDATSKTRLVLLDEKQLKIERKKVADAIAKENKRIADEKLRVKKLRKKDIYYDMKNQLMWQDNKTVIYQSNGKFTSTNYIGAKKYCRNLKLSGFDFWRLPSKKELLNLYEQKSQLKYIKDTNGYASWISYERKNNDYWGLDSYLVNFNNGYLRHANKIYANKVRCVRNRILSKKYKKTIYNDRKKVKFFKSKGIYYDIDTHLMWQDTRSTKTIRRHQKSAKNYCKKLKIGGFNDWRLPSYEKLDELYESTAKLKYPNHRDKEGYCLAYWTEVDSRGYPGARGSLGREYDGRDDTSTYYIRCVRNAK